MSKYEVSIIKVVFFGAVLFICSMNNALRCLTVSTSIIPSRQPAVTFPGGIDNLILNVAAFENGFTLQATRATCSFDNFFPVSGTVNLRGGKLFLKKDLLFDKSLNLTSSGSIFGASFSVEFSKFIPDLTISPSLFFDTTSLIFNGDTSINGPLQFTGNCKINGRGKRLSLQGNSALIVRPGGALVIEDAELGLVNRNNLRCLTDRGTITLRNCILSLSRDYTFSRGSILFEEDTLITGTSKFIYTTGLTSTISALATLFIDQGITFSYAPRSPKQNLINMTDNTAALYLNGCTLHSTRTGLQLSTGMLFFDNKVTLSSEALYNAEALLFRSSLIMNVMGGSTVNLFGRIRYD